MKKFEIVMPVLFLFFIAIAALATVEAASSKTRQLTGNVTAIDTAASTITVRKKDREVTLSVEEKTKIIECINKASITDIQIGDKVTTKYSEFPGRNTAKSITIRETVGKGNQINKKP